MLIVLIFLDRNGAWLGHIDLLPLIIWLLAAAECYSYQCRASIQLSIYDQYGLLECNLGDL